MSTEHPEDDLLHQLGERVRSDQDSESESIDERWTRLCLGTATEEEEAELRALAAADEQAASFEQAFRPLDDNFHSRLAEGARARLQAPQDLGSPHRTDDPVAHQPDPPSKLRSHGTRSRRRRSTARLLALAACLVLALGLATWMRPTGSSTTFSDISGATARLRSGIVNGTQSDSGVLHLRQSDDLFFTLLTRSKATPDQARSAEVLSEEVPGDRLTLFARSMDGRVIALPIEQEIRSPGKVEIRASLKGHRLPAGEITLIVGAHNTREIRKEQIEGTLKGRVQSLFFGSGQRLELKGWAEPREAELRVEFLGCREVQGDSTASRCVLKPDGSLRLWLSSSDPQHLVVRNGDQEWTLADAQPSADGWVFELRNLVPGVLKVDTRSTEQDERPESEQPTTWRLHLIPPVSLPNADAEAPTSELDVDRSTPEGARTLSHLAREAFKTGNYERTADLLRASARSHGEQKTLSAQIDDLTFLFYIYFELLGQANLAKEALDAFPQPIEGDLSSSYLISYYRGLWSLEVGELGQALHHLGQAARFAEHSGRIRDRNFAEQLMARLLRRLGRGREANAVLERLQQELPLMIDCDKVELLNNLAWDRLLQLEARNAQHTQAVAPTIELLNRGLRWLDGCAEIEAEERANFHLNLALAYFHAGDLGQAGQYLTQLQRLAASFTPRLRLWQLDLQSRIELAAGRPEQALAASRRLGELAAHRHWLEARWRASIGEARALRALGKNEKALTAMAAAESWLDEESRRIPLDADRAGSFASRGVSTADYLDLLLDQGLQAQAFAVARHARARLYRSIALGAAPGLLGEEELESWINTVRRYRIEQTAHSHEPETPKPSPAAAARRLRELEALVTAAIEPLDRSLGSGEAARPPALDPDEVVLLYHPLPKGAWVGFAAHQGDIRSHRFDPPAMIPGSPRLLEPFADLFTGASQIRILPYGSLSRVDFHALPLHGQPLLVTTPVVYGLDLPAVRKPSSSGTTGPDSELPTALLVGAPNRDLPAAEEEIARVRAALGDWQILPLPIASPQAVLANLGKSDLFHFAGHADFPGNDGLSSHLRLAGSNTLSAKDLLAAKILGPDLVVLSACDSARTSVDSTSPGLGLAQAFLLRGSRMVIGATQVIDDRWTQLFIGELYNTWNGSVEQAPEALRQAQLKLRASDSEAWKSFRVLAR